MNTQWKEQQVADLDGVLQNDGTLFSLDHSGAKELKRNPLISNWADIVILDQAKALNEKYRIICGECCGHGSMGAVVLENIESDQVEWTMLSSTSNPFHKIKINDDLVVVSSTSGSTFSFKIPFLEAKLNTP